MGGFTCRKSSSPKRRTLDWDKNIKIVSVWKDFSFVDRIQKRLSEQILKFESPESFLVGMLTRLFRHQFIVQSAQSLFGWFFNSYFSTFCHIFAPLFISLPWQDDEIEWSKTEIWKTSAREIELSNMQKKKKKEHLSRPVGISLWEGVRW